MPAVEPRYAAGLLAAAKTGEIAVKIEAELHDFSLALQNSTELKHFMFNPVIPLNAKKNVIKKLFDGKADALTENFLCLLVDKGRLVRLSGILSEFDRMRAESDEVLLIKVTSSEPLEQNRLDEISELYRKKYGAKSAKVEATVCPALLGGVRVQIGDTLFDSSLSSRLRGLASATGAINF